jgi:hypothetical protein
MRSFFERAQIALPFGTCLTIERGLDLMLKKDRNKAAELRSIYEGLLLGVEVIGNRDREIARVMAQIVGHPPLLNTWLPNERAKQPSYGHYPLVAATAIVTEMPIAAVKTKDLERIDAEFPLPGIFNPTNWSSAKIGTRQVPPGSPAAPLDSSAA